MLLDVFVHVRHILHKISNEAAIVLLLKNMLAPVDNITALAIYQSECLG